MIQTNMFKEAAQNPQPIKCELQDILPKFNKYIKQEHDIVQEYNVKHEYVDESTEYKDYCGVNDSQSTNQYYKKDFENTKENLKVQLKTEVDVFNDTKYENFFIRDNDFVSSFSSTTQYSINSYIENKPTNFNLNIESSTGTYTPTKHNMMTSEKNTQIKTEVDIIEDTMYESFFMRENNYVPTVESSTYYDINSPIKNNHKNACLNNKAPIITSNLTKKKLRRSKENSKKTHKCYICKKYFSWKGTMKTHMKLHLGKKPYQCLICNKSFAQVSTLYQHKMIHESHKPFNCAICKKSFAQKVNMKVHINKHMKFI
ncbi:myoneurin-like isoform X1 [Aphis gossypii]|uniref:myoneurin-like isoform X1 n=2 Tax=Aphis gossypii TaxID=80765 RepID=UPI0021590628|nr:myoneurin-like isoform X1 [Aphis gossypii]XP_050061045.1 myoneurin-like isoform X1 [Aphis gossypii]